MFAFKKTIPYLHQTRQTYQYGTNGMEGTGLENLFCFIVFSNFVIYCNHLRTACCRKC